MLVKSNLFQVSATLSNNNDRSTQERNDFGVVVGEAIKPFGFKGGLDTIPEGLGGVSDFRSVKHTFYSWDLFSPERMNVAVDATLLRVTVNDYLSSTETEFDRSVIDAIQQHVLERYGTKIDFKRQYYYDF